MAHQSLLSPAELAFLHSSLSLRPPIRPDGRSATQFRPLTAETGILPGTNGSARVCFADGTEAIVGVKAEIARTGGGQQDQQEDEGKDEGKAKRGPTSDWVEMAIEIPGLRDDDAGTVFLGEMLREALLGDGDLTRRLEINSRFHWHLYLDVRSPVPDLLASMSSLADPCTYRSSSSRLRSRTPCRCSR